MTTRSMHDQLRKPRAKNLNKPNVDRTSYRTMVIVGGLMAIASLVVVLTTAKNVNAMAKATQAEAAKSSVKKVVGYDSKYLLSPEVISYREMRRYGKVSDIGHAE